MKKKFLALVLASGMTLASLHGSMVSFAEEEKEESKYEDWVLEEAEECIKFIEDKQEYELSDKEKQDMKYQKHMKRLVELDRELTELERALGSGRRQDVGKLCYDSKTELGSMAIELSKLDVEPAYEYAKRSLIKSCNYLGDFYGRLALYDSQLMDGQEESAKFTIESFKKEKDEYQFYFEQAYNYYIMTRNGELLSSEFNQTESEFCRIFKSNMEVFHELCDTLEKAVNDGAIGDKMVAYTESLKKSMVKIAINDMNTFKYKGIKVKLGEVYSISSGLTLGMEKLKSDEGKKEYMEKTRILKSKLQELDSLLLEVEKEVTAIDKNASGMVKAMEEQRLKEAVDKGFESLEVFEADLEDKKKEERHQRLLAEAEKIKDRSEILEKKEQRWKDEWIDFDEPRSKQRHDKEYYMEMIEDYMEYRYPFDVWQRENAEYYEIESNGELKKRIWIGTRKRYEQWFKSELEDQSEAYETLWSIMESKSWDVQRMKRSCDAYPLDVTEAVEFYELTRKLELNRQRMEEKQERYEEKIRQIRINTHLYY